MNLYVALSASANDGTGFFEDLWNYLYDVYLRVDGNYENIGFEKTPLFSLRLTVLGIFLGAIIACVAMAYNKQFLGGAVRKMIACEALSRDKAMSLEELGYNKNVIMRNAFRSSVSLRRVVRCVGEEEFLAERTNRREEYEKRREAGEKLPKFKEIEYVIDPDTDKFYIPEELRIRAEVKFEKKGSTWVSSLITAILLCVLFFVVLLILPMIFGAADEFLGSFK